MFVFFLLKWLSVATDALLSCAESLWMFVQVSEIAEAAFECWWQDQHPGWMIFTLGNNHFESLDQIIKVPSHLSPQQACHHSAHVELICRLPVYSLSRVHHERELCTEDQQ